MSVPTRGQLGNALKCVWAAPFVIDGERGLVEIDSNGVHHRIEVSLDLIAQQPRLHHEQKPSDVKNGTFVKIWWPGIASKLLVGQSGIYNAPSVRTLLRDYALLNPHASFSLETGEDTLSYPATTSEWSKWLPSRPTSPHWYTPEHLRGLIAAYLTADQPTGKKRTVRELVAEFDGLRGSAKQKAVTEAAGLSGALLRDLVIDGDLATDAIARLLEAMQAATRPIKPKALGVLGETHLIEQAQRTHGAEPIWTKKVEGIADGLPFVVEAACGIKTQEGMRSLIVGLNWSPVFKIPITDLNRLLNENRVDSMDRLVFVLHIACPRFEFTERGKGAVVLPLDMRKALEKCVCAVIKHWRKIKRGRDAADRVDARDMDRLRKQQQRQFLSIKSACFRVMEEAYLLTSDNGRLPAQCRQIMYSARRLALPLTDDKWVKNSATFTQQYLQDYLEAHSEQTKDWDIVFDARGKLIEPHTNHRVDLGTLAVRQYIAGWHGHIAELPTINLSQRCPTAGPRNRYRFALFVEKEGFEPLLAAGQIASRYDIAIMSTKGMSVTAARALVERLSEEGVTVLVLRDFDKAGFSIVHTLRSDTRRYKFKTKPRVIDLGLRLADAQAMGLQSEYVSYHGKEDPRNNLRTNGATEEEIVFLVSGRDRYSEKWIGRRVELNAMTSRQFLDFLEEKLIDAGVQKLIPDPYTLSRAYRRAVRLAKAQKAFDDITRSSDSSDISVPDDLSEQIQTMIEGTGRSWDMALAALAEK